MKRLADMDYNTMNKKANIVERNAPQDIPVVNALKIAKQGHSDIVQLAMEIEKADNFVYANACNKLKVLAQQVRFLQEQAKKVLLDAKTDLNLHHAACNFIKVPGNIYHLYRRNSGQEYFSMLSPEEWNIRHDFIGSFRLETDQSWTPIKNISQKDSEFTLINKILVNHDVNNSLFAVEGIAMET